MRMPVSWMMLGLALVLTAAGCSTAAESEDAHSPPPVQETKAADSGEVDFSCSTDADCTVKNVGNCCGYYPACVNVDSQTFPDQVQAECERTGMSSICGFPEITACACVEGRCEAAASGGGAVQPD